MKAVTITIPDNCELVREGNTYVIKEKDIKPKSWEEFCKSNKIQAGEYYLQSNSELHPASYYSIRDCNIDRNVCVSKEEAEAFLALMQLRQLRKAWVGDWKFTEGRQAYAIVARKDGTLEVGFYDTLHRSMLFPTRKMTADFLNCFRDLCETAKILL